MALRRRRSELEGKDSRRQLVADALHLGFLGLVSPLALMRISCGAATSTSTIDSKDVWLVAGYSGDPVSGKPVASDNSNKRAHFLLATNLGTKESTRIALPFAAHSVLKHPKKAYTVLAIPEPNRLGMVAEINLREKRVTHSFRGSSNSGFFGHGAFAGDGTHLLLSEGETGSTVVTIRDPLTYEKLGQINSGANSPHDLRYFGEKILVGHLGGLSILDAKSEKLEKVLVSPLANDALIHLDVAANGNIFALSASRKNYANGGVRVRDPGHVFMLKQGESELRHLKSDREFAGQALSSAFHEPSKTLIVTHFEDDALSFWHSGSGEYLGWLALPHKPHGVVLSPDGKSFLVANEKAELAAVSPESRTITNIVLESGLVGNNAHLLSTTFG